MSPASLTDALNAAIDCWHEIFDGDPVILVRAATIALGFVVPVLAGTCAGPMTEWIDPRPEAVAGVIDLCVVFSVGLTNMDANKLLVIFAALRLIAVSALLEYSWLFC